jgi:hypothetical protein
VGTDCKSALSYIRDFFTYPSDRALSYIRDFFTYPSDRGNHPQYDFEIDKKITSIIKKASDDKIGALIQIKKLIKETKATLKNEVLLGTKNVNDITKF